jgi:hypothetical protein
VVLHVALLVLTLSVALQAQAETEARVQSLPAEDERAGPSWLGVSLEHRSRYESVSNRFRLGESGGDQQLAQRTRLRFEFWDVERPLSFFVELQDSRVHLSDSGSYVNASHVDETDILQLQLRIGSESLPGTDIPFRLQLGRFTMDLGGRRLFARNQWRNTTNALDGLTCLLGGNESWHVTAFLARPVFRLPKRLDFSDPDTHIWGVFLRRTERRLDFDVYYFGRHENDETLTRRRYTTLGSRVFKNPAPGEVDFEIESVFQFGKQGELDHLAHFQHGEIGYSIDARWAPHLTFAYDHASGDRDPEDERHGRFHMPFGARRFELMPTGIFNPFYRANLATPGFRITLTPSGRLDVMASYRAFWLAQSRDGWEGSGLRDPSGASGSFVGNHVEARLRWTAVGGTTFEAGWARLFKGSFPDRVPGSPRTGDSSLFYFSVDVLLAVLTTPQR